MYIYPRVFVLVDYNKGFWYFIWVNSKEVYGLPITIFAIILSLIASFGKIISVKAGLSALFILVSIIMIAIFYKSSYELYTENKKLMKNKLKLPKIIEGRPPYTKNPKAKTLLLLEPSDSFGYNILVSLYYFKGRIEQLIGFGVVINIQEGKFIQVEIDRIFDGHEDIIERMKHNDAECLKNALVKPFIPTEYLDHLEEVVVNDGE